MIKLSISCTFILTKEKVTENTLGVCNRKANELGLKVLQLIVIRMQKDIT